MALSNERINEIAFLVLMDKIENEGLPLKPKEVKRSIINNAKKSGIPARDLAEFVKIIFEKLYNKTVSEFDQLIKGQVEE